MSSSFEFSFSLYVVKLVGWLKQGSLSHRTSLKQTAVHASRCCHASACPRLRSVHSTFFIPFISFITYTLGCRASCDPSDILACKHRCTIFIKIEARVRRKPTLSIVLLQPQTHLSSWLQWCLQRCSPCSQTAAPPPAAVLHARWPHSWPPAASEWSPPAAAHCFCPLQSPSWT